MITRTFKLCLNAGTGSAPYINVSQYDEGETWLFELYSETGERYIPSTGAIVGVKSDGHGIVNTGTVDNEGRVVITETQQMTASAGRAIFELSIDGLTHGTANFIVAVERKPTDEAVMSDSDLSLIQEAVNSAAEIEDLLDGQDVPTVITPIISDWLDENITNPSNPPIDTSLTVAGAAADAKVTGDEITDLKSAMTEVDDALFDPSKNVYDTDMEWVNGTFSSGTLVEQTTGLNNAATVDYIPVTAEENWVISWKAVDLNCNMYVETYDASKTWISSLGNSAMNAVTRSRSISTPETCAYIRLRIYRTDADWQTIIPTEIQVEKGTIPTEYEPKTNVSKLIAINADIDELQEEVANNPALTQRREVATDTNVLFPSVKGYLKNDGTFNTTTNGWQRSDYIPVTPYTFMYFHGINTFNYYGFFDENKTWIGGKNIETPVVSDNSYLISHQVPSNAHYMIVSFEDTDAPTAWGNYTPTIPTGEIIYANTDTLRAYKEHPTNPCDYEGLDACAFRKGLCIGDSLTGGGFNYSTGTNPWSDGNVYSYPSQFQKMTGIPMTNEGHSGRTTVQWWEHYGTGGDSEIDLSGYDFAIIHLGVNDVSYNVPTADTQTAYQNIIDALKSANTGIKIFVCTIIPAYAIEGITSYDTINALIESFASQENVYVCDLTTYGHTYKNSEYTAGHLTAYGYWRMAKDLISYIGYIMRQKPAEFRFIQYIGTDMTY